MNFKLSLKWKLIVWLTVIGFITSILIHFSLIYIGYSKISYTMKRMPIMKWHHETIIDPFKKLVYIDKPLNKNHQVKLFLESLVKEKSYVVLHDDIFFTEIFIESFAVVDLNSNLLFQTSNAKLLEGDVGSQIPIQSRDDLSDAITGRNNSGIEEVGNNQYLVIKNIESAEGVNVGILLSWQSWRIEENEEPFFYISSLRALSIALFNTLAIFIWILPSTFILGWLVATIFRRRYRSFYTTVEGWGEGKLSEKIKVTGNDEISDSFRTLNLMAERFHENQVHSKKLIGLEERQNLASELHDTVKQQLFASNLQLATALQLAEDKPEESYNAIRKAISQNQVAFNQVNDLIMALNPMPISSSLEKSLNKAFDDWKRNHEVEIDAVIEINDRSTNQNVNPLTQIQIQVIYRSIMECLQNISKHSNATKVVIFIQRKEKSIKWSIEDNGIVNNKLLLENEPEFGQGLNLMKNQIKGLKGTMEVEFSKGFHLRADFPI